MLISSFPYREKHSIGHLKGAEGVRIGIDPEPDNPKKSALHLSFLGGRVGDHSVSQKLTLSPGNYRMSGTANGQPGRTARRKVASLMPR